MDHTEYLCTCGTAGCLKTLALARGVTPNTVTLGVREHGRTLAQAYLTPAQVLRLADELVEWARGREERAW